MKKLMMGLVFALLLVGFAFAAEESAGDGVSNESSLTGISATNFSRESASADEESMESRAEGVNVELAAAKRAREQIDANKQVKREVVESEIRARVELRINEKNISINPLDNERKEIIVNKINAKTGLNLTSDDIGNGTRLRAYLSNGRWAEVKIMPDSASERALERLRLKVCNESRGCIIELKETGDGNQTELQYELQTERQSRVFGIFKAKMKVKAMVNAENGEVFGVGKPWWAFLASEPEEEAEVQTE